MLAKFMTTASLVFLIPLSSFASEIRQRPFAYSFDAASAQSGDTFVVCSDCPDNKLTILPAIAKLAVRMSDPMTIQPPATQPDVVTVTPRNELPENKGLLGTVHFQLNSSRLSLIEQGNLEKISRDIPAGNAVDVTGYTCTIGTDDYNKKLSFRRAEAVATALKAKGVNISTIEGRGKCCPASQDKQQNRRVEIIGLQKEGM
jgi:outer membrane protein OmpA-like peptidoglycan-associated protein